MGSSEKWGVVSWYGGKEITGDGLWETTALWCWMSVSSDIHLVYHLRVCPYRCLITLG